MVDLFCTLPSLEGLSVAVVTLLQDSTETFLSPSPSLLLFSDEDILTGATTLTYLVLSRILCVTHISTKQLLESNYLQIIDPGLEN
jgi:hypothetical protein